MKIKTHGKHVSAPKSIQVSSALFFFFLFLGERRHQGEAKEAFAGALEILGC